MIDEIIKKHIDYMEEMKANTHECNIKLSNVFISEGVFMEFKGKFKFTKQK